MTPQARAQAAIEILDEVIVAARDAGAAADTIVARYFRTRRYAGAKDRRAVRDLVYRAIRRAGERPDVGRAALVGLAREDEGLAASFDGSPRAPAPIAAGEAGAAAGVAPAWLARQLAETLDAEELAALSQRAPLDIRVNRLRADRDEVAALFPDAMPLPATPGGLRLAEGTAVEASPGFAQGLFEVQDEGSQLVAVACRPTSGMTVLDLCAGAGGKTLALAAAMAGQGRLVACDVDRNRLARLAPRADRAGVDALEMRLLNPDREAEALGDLVAAADVVLVDAPCSGTGTWRRNPEARWRLTPARIERLTTLQARLLDLAATLVKPGGTLVYAVCSLLDAEGGDQAAAFLARTPGWTTETPFGAGRSHGPGRRLAPGHDGTDGFFVARLVAPW
ncbi:MAG: RsmB/NOP family class I SAM-dependent RNA methyltransferase [Sphingomonadaceae bacterium]|nr:RsmB/NOP family class I SAM-dependent RNA methyltransferase [Sphingomonadaceae bacterium]